METMKICSILLVLAVISSAALGSVDRGKRQVEESPEQTSYEAEDLDLFEDEPPRRWRTVNFIRFLTLWLPRTFD
jgi:hypothetical protein